LRQHDLYYHTGYYILFGVLQKVRAAQDRIAGVHVDWNHPLVALWDMPIGNLVSLCDAQCARKELVKRPMSE